MAALWMAHWSDEEGRVSLGQLVEITNQDALAFQKHPSLQLFPAWPRLGACGLPSPETDNPPPLPL